jgi:hypothetical protein
MSTNGWMLCGGAAAVFLGSLLPWVDVSNALGISVSAKPRSGGVVLFLILAAGAVAFGWPSTRDELSKRRLLGLTVAAALLTIFAITNWSDLADLQNRVRGQAVQINAGFGLYLYTAGVAAIWGCVARVFLADRRRSSSAVETA